LSKDIEAIAAAVETFAADAIAWNGERSTDRIQAIEYYDGTMRDTPSDDGRSSIVSRDFRAATKKVLPAIVRTILGSDRVVEFEPVGREDEPGAAQSTDFVNEVVMPESGGESVIHDAVHDALRVRNGIIKYWWDQKKDTKVTRHSGLTPEEVAVLASVDSVQVLEQEPAPDGTISLKLRRTINDGRVAMACIPAEEFFIDRDARCIEDAYFCAHNQQLRRSALIAMGYDKDRVWDLPAWQRKTNDQQSEEQTRRDDATDGRSTDNRKELDEIDFWECFVRIDEDGDGIAELRRMVFVGGWQALNLFEDEETDEAPFADIVIERRPHEWLGRSLFDDIYEVQRVKTVLTRSTLDNIYWQNNPQPIVARDTIENMDSVNNPGFGQPIVIKSGMDATKAVGFNTVPFVGAQSFEMLGYMDNMLKDRTGISDASGGLPPDALQNVTAKASALYEQAAISQVELMVRNVAVGLRRLFRGILKLVIQHQDKPRTVRLRNTWVEVDPRSWNADMDAMINVGLGAGTRERDMMAMQVVTGVQTKFLESLGAANNPFVTPENLYNGAAKLFQAAGIRNIDMFLTKPDPQAVQALIAQKAQQPSPEQIKAQAAIQVKQVEAQVHTQTEAAKAAANRDKEQSQMQADLVTTQAQTESDERIANLEAQNKMAIEMNKIAAQQQIEREKMANQASIAQAQREHEAAHPKPVNNNG